MNGELFLFHLGFIISCVSLLAAIDTAFNQQRKSIACVTKSVITSEKAELKPGVESLVRIRHDVTFMRSSSQV